MRTKKTIRVADYIINYIYKHGTDTIFTLAGGGAMYLNDAVALHKKIKYICQNHEGSCAYAAEAYAKLSGRVGACMVTSGPASTNAISGLLEAWQNSIPVIFISSQAPLKYMGVTRQFGVQEVSIIPVVYSLTKYAGVMEKAEDAKTYMDVAYEKMLEGRKGPVWLDIPMDVANTLWKN